MEWISEWTENWIILDHSILSGESIWVLWLDYYYSGYPVISHIEEKQLSESVLIQLLRTLSLFYRAPHIVYSRTESMPDETHDSFKIKILTTLLSVGYGKNRNKLSLWWFSMSQMFFRLFEIQLQFKQIKFSKYFYKLSNRISIIFIYFFLKFVD